MTPVRPAKRSGFTLIEVLVALAVASLALLALARAGSAALDTQAELEQRTLALWVADNRLAELRLLRPVQPGTSRGSTLLGERQWRWQSLIQPAPGGELWRIDVVVLDDNDKPLLTHVGFMER
jgi:general secretion pathway protein I